MTRDAVAKRHREPWRDEGREMAKTLEPLIVPLADITALTGQSKPVLHDAINAGDLETFLVGRRRFARIEAIRAWVDKLEAASKAGKPICYRSREALGDKREAA